MLIYVKLQDLYGFCMQSIQPRTRPQIYIHVAIALWRLQCEWCWYYISMGVPVFGYSFFYVVVELWNIKHHAFLCNGPASYILCMRFDKFSLLYLPMDLISAKLKQIFVQCQNLGLPCLERLSDILSSPSIDPMLGTCTSEKCT